MVCERWNVGSLHSNLEEVGCVDQAVEDGPLGTDVQAHFVARP
jgi:hypothetical protein